MQMTFTALFFFAYFLGAIPFGLLLGRFFADVDIRAMGSGNIGATNVNRVLGRKLGAATLGCDIVKGIVPVLLARLLLPGETFDQTMVGLAAFLGHCFPIYLRFHGGKGVATMFGVLSVLSFYSALIVFAIWFSVAKLSRISSLGALTSSLTIPVVTYIFIRDFRVMVVMLAMTVILIYRHKENIQRLRAGTEK